MPNLPFRKGKTAVSIIKLLFNNNESMNDDPGRDGPEAEYQDGGVKRRKNTGKVRDSH
jgi:hypothetical protein